MTDPVRTVSPKTSPYRSKIQTRLATSGLSTNSLGFHSPIQRSRSVDCHAVSNEKLQLKKLNDQFLSYIERVRLFETYNRCLTAHADQIKTVQERTQTKIEALKQEFEEFQHERIQRESKDVQLENHHTYQIEQQVDENKTKQKFFQSEHEEYRKQIIELQKKSIDIQAKTEQLRCDYNHLMEDTCHYRNQISNYQTLKTSIVDEIHRQRDLQQRIQLEVEDLKMQRQLNTQTHEADVQALQIHHDNILYDLTNNFRFDAHGKTVFTQMLNEIREEYRLKDRDMRDELHRKYMNEYNQHVKKTQDKQFLENTREDFELRQLTNEFNSLNENRTLLRQKLTMIQEHHKHLEETVQREMQRKARMQNKYDEQINRVQFSIREYEHLLNDSKKIRSHSLTDEVNKYRQLLEGSEQEIGLRQLIHLPSSIEQARPPSRPTTPPPPRTSPTPPPPLTRPSALLPTPPPLTRPSALLPTPPPLTRPSALLPPQPPPTTTLLVIQQQQPRTRQNSMSEISFDTAPASQATSVSNPSYGTLNSVPNPIVTHEYDTDNDHSQTTSFVSGRQSRIISETDVTPKATTPTDQESLPSFPPHDILNTNETIVEIPIETSLNEVNQTLPFIPMNSVPPLELHDIEEIITEGHQSPIISTVEQREEEQQQQQVQMDPEPIVLVPPETIIPITIHVDSKLVEEVPIEKLVSPTTPTMPTIVEEKSSVSPPSRLPTPPLPTISPSGESSESATQDTPIVTVTTISPLAKLISSMLPNATPFVPSLNPSNDRPVSPTPTGINSIMNNDAVPFIPNQQQPQQHMTSGSQHQTNNPNNSGGYWNGRGGNTGGGGNRRGQNGGYHHGGGGSGGGNQRAGGGGGNWQSGGGGGHHKQRRGLK